MQSDTELKKGKREENDPSIEYKNLLKSTLNRLTNQYLCLLKAASSEMALSDLQVDPRGELQLLIYNV
jgi:hypothetical protein